MTEELQKSVPRSCRPVLQWISTLLLGRQRSRDDVEDDGERGEVQHRAAGAARVVLHLGGETEE